MRNRQKKKLKAKKDALDLIPKLLEKAKKDFKDGKKDSARKYALKTRYLQMKYKLRLPAEIKRQFCSHCHNILIPLVTSRVRVGKGRIVIYCMACKSRLSSNHNRICDICKFTFCQECTNSWQNSKTFEEANMIYHV